MFPWTPDPIWEGKDCYIIGGGPSLKEFDWDLIKDEHTIGCNTAFRLGSEICDVLIFGDKIFWDTYREDIGAEYDGLVVSNLPSLEIHIDSVPDWVHVMRRKERGLAQGDTLGWNRNTGAAAVNLALLFGVQTVYLLGFDMRLRNGKSNWHDESCFSPNDRVYTQFIKGFENVASDLETMFPDREIINVSNDTGLYLFPIVSIEEHFGIGNGQNEEDENGEGHCGRG